MYYRNGTEVRNELIALVYNLATDASAWTLSKSENGVDIYNNRAHFDPRSGIVCSKAVSWVDCSAQELFQLLLPSERQFEIDEMVQRVQILEEYDSYNEVVFMRYNSFIPNVVPRCFVLYRACGMVPNHDGHYVLACRSIQYDKEKLNLDGAVLCDCAPRYVVHI